MSDAIVSDKGHLGAEIQRKSLKPKVSKRTKNAESPGYTALHHCCLTVKQQHIKISDPARQVLKKLSKESPRLQPATLLYLLCAHFLYGHLPPSN